MMDRPYFPRIIFITLLTLLLVVYLAAQFLLPNPVYLDSKNTRGWSFFYFKQVAQVPVSVGRDDATLDDVNAGRDRFLIGVGKADITGYVSSKSPE